MKIISKQDHNLQSCTISLVPGKFILQMYARNNNVSNSLKSVRSFSKIENLREFYLYLQNPSFAISINTIKSII